MKYAMMVCALLVACGDDGSSTPSDAAVGGPDAAANIDAAPVPPDARVLPDAAVATCTPQSGTNLALELVTSGLSRPLFVTAPAGDRRLFVVEQPGRIRIVEDDTLVATPFLDIRAIVHDLAGEQGLLGLAFHPDYANNGRFFVNYTASDPQGDTVVAEYRVSSDPYVADPTSERRVIVIDQPFTNHNGGMIDFGPDGFLYVGMGDGGDRDDRRFDHGENPATLLGSLLRIDVDTGDPYGIPSDNPYADSDRDAGSPRPEIWAIGLRNPWRYSFDPANGDLYIADVGQNLWEEINVNPSTMAGLNYGWNHREGAHCFEPASGCLTAGLVDPVAEYGHSGGKCSITGGYVYRGSCLPDIQGWYFFADACTDQIWKIEHPGNTALVDLTADLGAGPDRVSSFGRDAVGELYITSLRNGRLYRIVGE